MNFSHFLYIRYIKPYVDACPTTGFGQSLSLMEND